MVIEKLQGENTHVGVHYVIIGNKLAHIQLRDRSNINNASRKPIIAGDEF